MNTSSLKHPSFAYERFLARRVRPWAKWTWTAVVIIFSIGVLFGVAWLLREACLRSIAAYNRYGIMGYHPGRVMVATAGGFGAAIVAAGKGVVYGKI